MNRYKNARLTPLGRERAVKRVLGGEPAAVVAEAVGVSESRLYSFIRRWKAEGHSGLQDRSSKPNHTPHRTTRGPGTAGGAAPAKTLERASDRG